MATGLPGRVVLVCAVVASATPSRAQPRPAAPANRPLTNRPLTLPAAPASRAAAAAPATVAPVAVRRPVAVISLTDDPTADELADQLNSALSNHVDLRLLTNLTFVQALRGPFADEERGYLDAARTSKQEAEDFRVNQLDYANAERAALRGAEALHRVRMSPEVLGLYAELAFEAGQAALKQRKPNDASLAFGLSYRLDSAKRPDPARYEPDIVEAYQLAVTKIPVAAKLEVKGTGTVWIDGVDRGPPGVFDVAQGLHLIQLSGADRETRGHQVSIPDVSAIEIEAAPASDERKIERARVELAHTRDAAARAGAMKRLAQLLGVGDAVLIEKSDAGLRVQTWRDRQPGFSALVDHKTEPPGDLLIPLAPPRKVEPVKPEEPHVVGPIVIDKPFYRKSWFYGSVALGVVAAAITIYVAATQEHMLGVDNDIKPEGE